MVIFICSLDINSTGFENSSSIVRVQKLSNDERRVLPCEAVLRFSGFQPPEKNVWLHCINLLTVWCKRKHTKEYSYVYEKADYAVCTHLNKFIEFIQIMNYWHLCLPFPVPSLWVRYQVLYSCAFPEASTIGHWTASINQSINQSKIYYETNKHNIQIIGDWSKCRSINRGSARTQHNKMMPCSRPPARDLAL